MADPIKSRAGHVLATSEDKDAKALASYVLAGGEPLSPAPEKTHEELTRILNKIDGVEGQSERANMIRQQIYRLEQAR